MIQLQENGVEMFPVERLLKGSKIDPEKIIKQREPILLLSQISGLERELVEQLEIAGIFDTDDLQSCGEEIWKHLNLDTERIQDITAVVAACVRSHASTPTLVQPLPDNYALLVVREQKLGVLWSGMLVVLDGDEYWFGVKDQLEKLLTDMDHPQLLGRPADHHPHWLQRVISIDEHISNISGTRTDPELAGHWGLTVSDDLEGELLACGYLVELALANR
ncbi:MAG: hypothetical protein ACXAE3_03565 [Candidatus Kariarchaeaceae archaeon]|jgi:hypothetical protein